MTAEKRDVVEMVALQAQPTFAEEVLNKIYDINTRLVKTYGIPQE